jgi:hypothetical protein
VVVESFIVGTFHLGRINGMCRQDCRLGNTREAQRMLMMLKNYTASRVDLAPRTVREEAT